MKLLQRFFQRSNPTRDWPAARLWAPEVDLDQGSVAGVRIGEPLDGLQALGPGQPLSDSIVLLPEHGLALGHEAGRLTELCAVLDGEASDFTPKRFQGRVRFRGQELSTDRPLEERALISLLGEPWDRNDAHGVTLGYRSEVWEYEFDCYDAGHVVEIWIFARERD